jgi:peptidoglycan-N-acetylglucosamine deacetylase
MKSLIILQSKLFLFVIFLVIFSLGCNEQLTPPEKINKAGFCLTFDDTYVEQWNKIIPLLDSCNVKVTFFLTQIYSISDQEISLLQNFKADGQEIGCHGWKHINAITFLENHTISDYILQEIIPALNFMDSYNLAPSSFSYPYGYNCDTLDNALLQTFALLRDVEEIQRTTGVTNVKNIDDIFYKFDNTKVIPALGIDANFKISLDMIETGFKKASENNEVIVFYAHQPVGKVNGSYQIEFEYLRKLFALAKKYDLKSYTFSELVK